MPDFEFEVSIEFFCTVSELGEVFSLRRNGDILERVVEVELLHDNSDRVL